MTEERKSVLLKYPFGAGLWGGALLRSSRRTHFKQVIAAAYERELKRPPV